MGHQVAVRDLEAVAVYQPGTPVVQHFHHQWWYKPPDHGPAEAMLTPPAVDSGKSLVLTTHLRSPWRFPANPVH